MDEWSLRGIQDTLGNKRSIDISGYGLLKYDHTELRGETWCIESRANLSELGFLNTQRPHTNGIKR